MPSSSVALARRRSAQLAAKSITTEPEVVVTPPHVIKARASFSYFCDLMGKPAAKHMKEWHKAFLTGESNEHLLDIAGPNTCLLSPRGSAKSTVIGLLVAWLIGRHATAKKLLRTLYVSYNVDVSRNKSAAIKNLIMNKEYQEIFPTVRLSKTRTSDELWSIDFDFAEIDIRGEDAFTVACAGLKGTITSKRSSLIIVDDAIKSAAAIANPDIRREMETNWNNVIVPTMFQGARAIALGTRFHFDDLFTTTFCAKRGWKVITQGALHYTDDGTPKSYWPSMWSAKYLLKLQGEDRIAFSYQYLNQPVKTTELGLSPELFVRGEVPDDYDMIGVGIDLSAGMSERNDWTVFTLAGRVGDKVYIIDYRRMRSMGNIEKIEALCELLMEWNLKSKRRRTIFSE
jgi:hypothetical protein